jgi:hypothetical protein
MNASAYKLAAVTLTAAIALLLGAMLTAAQQPQQTKPAVAPLPTVLPKGKKLFLTDGTFHLVRSYERRGERVRFYSVERSEWEEIPASLVDWEATKKAEAEAGEKTKQLEEKIKEIETTQIAAEVDVDSSLEVAPGVFLPEKEGLYVIEGNKVLAVGEAEADVKRNKGRTILQILSPIPVVPTQHKVELKGAKAERRVTTLQPEFYVRLAEDREPELELIRAKVKGNIRQIEAISTYITGQSERNRLAISVQRWRVAKGVFRITMSQTLAPGEYVLAEILTTEEGKSGISLQVWDFGVDGPAPEVSKKK